MRCASGLQRCVITLRILDLQWTVGLKTELCTLQKILLCRMHCKLQNSHCFSHCCTWDQLCLVDSCGSLWMFIFSGPKVLTRFLVLFELWLYFWSGTFGIVTVTHLTRLLKTLNFKCTGPQSQWTQSHCTQTHSMQLLYNVHCTLYTDMQTSLRAQLAHSGLVDEGLTLD